VLRKDPVPCVSCCLKVTLLIHIITTLVTLSCHVNTFHLLAVYFMRNFLLSIFQTSQRNTSIKDIWTLNFQHVLQIT
jgi:hypothetical protein